MSDFPMLLYVYRKDGRHTGSVRIPDGATLAAKMVGDVKVAIMECREVVITDLMDVTLFHAKDGDVVFPTPEDQ